MRACYHLSGSLLVLLIQHCFANPLPLPQIEDNLDTDGPYGYVPRVVHGVNKIVKGFLSGNPHHVFQGAFRIAPDDIADELVERYNRIMGIPDPEDLADLNETTEKGKTKQKQKAKAKPTQKPPPKDVKEAVSMALAASNSPANSISVSPGDKIVVASSKTKLGPAVTVIKPNKKKEDLEDKDKEEDDDDDDNAEEDLRALAPILYPYHPAFIG